jgi:hypothetical protein
LPRLISHLALSVADNFAKPAKIEIETYKNAPAIAPGIRILAEAVPKWE